MILKMRSENGWMVVPGIETAEYSNAASRQMGFYVNKKREGHPVVVVVVKSFMRDEDVYYPHDDIAIVRSRSSDITPHEVRVHGCSRLERDFVGEEGNYGERLQEVVFLPWLRDTETHKTFLFDEAYLLNDNGKTIEHIR
jgi:hypothetical protein